MPWRPSYSRHFDVARQNLRNLKVAHFSRQSTSKSVKISKIFIYFPSISISILDSGYGNACENPRKAWDSTRLLSFLLLARKVYNSVFKSFMSTLINLFLSILIFLASIPSPTETTSLCPCSCDTPSKDLQSYATSAFSSEEGSTSSLHFSSSSTFKSSFYGSSLCYCRCSTTKSTIYEMRKYIQLRNANNLPSFVTDVNFHW